MVALEVCTLPHTIWASSSTVNSSSEPWVVTSAPCSEVHEPSSRSVGSWVPSTTWYCRRSVSCCWSSWSESISSSDIWSKAASVGAKTVSSSSESSVSTSSAWSSISPSVDSMELWEIAVATGSSAMLPRLPSPSSGISEHSEPKVSSARSCGSLSSVALSCSVGDPVSSTSPPMAVSSDCVLPPHALSPRARAAAAAVMVSVLLRIIVFSFVSVDTGGCLCGGCAPWVTDQPHSSGYPHDHSGCLKLRRRWPGLRKMLFRATEVGSTPRVEEDIFRTSSETIGVLPHGAQDTPRHGRADGLGQSPPQRLYHGLQLVVGHIRRWPAHGQRGVPLRTSGTDLPGHRPGRGDDVCHHGPGTHRRLHGDALRSHLRRRLHRCEPEPEHGTHAGRPAIRTRLSTVPRRRGTQVRLGEPERGRPVPGTRRCHQRIHPLLPPSARRGRTSDLRRKRLGCDDGYPRPGRGGRDRGTGKPQRTGSSDSRQSSLPRGEPDLRQPGPGRGRSGRRRLGTELRRLGDRLHHPGRRS